MIFIRPNEDGLVDIFYKPFDQKHGLGKTKEQLEQEGLLVDSIPEPEQQEGKIAILYVNPETKELYYQYEDIPKIEEQIAKEELESIKAQLQVTQEAIDFLIMGGM